MQLHHRLVSILQRIRQDVATLLDKEAINAACREEKYTWKDRLLNPANTVHLFILQILNHNTPLNDLPRKSGESFTGSAFCKARKRLPLGVFKSLLRRLADTLLPHSGRRTRSTTKAAGSAIGPSSWTVRVAPCLTPPSCRETSVSRATNSRLWFPCGPSDGSVSRRHGAAPGASGLPAADPRHVSGSSNSIPRFSPATSAWVTEASARTPTWPCSSSRGSSASFGSIKRSRSNSRSAETRPVRGQRPARPASPLAAPIGGDGPVGGVDQTQEGSQVDDRRRSTPSCPGVWSCVNCGTWSGGPGSGPRK